MNSKKQPIKQALKTYYFAKALSNKQLQALHEQQDVSDHNQSYLSYRTLKWVGSVAASLVVFFMVFSYTFTPAVVTAAYADIALDANTNNGMQLSLTQWMNKNQINPVPQQYKVEMSKFCQLDQFKTTHLRIAGIEQGKMHVFFHHGEPPIHWLNRSGTKGHMKWRLVKIREDLTLIVMHTFDMRNQSVQHILAGILPELLT